MTTADTTEQTPLEYNLEKAHKALVNAKYALHAVAGSTELDAQNKSEALGNAVDLEDIIDHVHAMRFLKQEPMSFQEVFDALVPLVGEKVRLTYPNGAEHTGVLSRRDIGVHDCLWLDGHLAGGEIEGAIKIEKKVGWRYQTV